MLLLQLQDHLYGWKKKSFTGCKNWKLVDGTRYCDGDTQLGVMQDPEGFTRDNKNIHPKHAATMGTYRDHGIPKPEPVSQFP